MTGLTNSLTVTVASAIAGIGFRVSLLVGDLAYGAGSERDEHVKEGVLVGSLLAAAMLRTQQPHLPPTSAEEALDSDTDGTTEVLEATTTTT